MTANLFLLGFVLFLALLGWSEIRCLKQEFSQEIESKLNQREQELLRYINSTAKPRRKTFLPSQAKAVHPKVKKSRASKDSGKK